MAGKKGMRSGLKSVLPVKLGIDFAEQVDGRSLLGRAVRDRLDRLYQDLGGIDALSFQQQALATRAIWLDLLLTNEEAKIARGEGIDIEPHVKLCGSLLSIFRALGLKRVARNARLHDVLKKGKATD
jgi:hypothetical protein